MATEVSTDITTTEKKSPFNIMASRLNVEPGGLMTILKRTIFKPTDNREPMNEEIAAYVMVANQYRLNPFLKQLHAFVDKRGGIVPVVGIDGWARIVNDQKEYDGCDFSYVEGDDGKPVEITCAMHVKDRGHPTVVTERFKECYRPTAPWNTMPFRMLRHKAFMQAARLAFGIAGIYDEDEARDIVERGAVIDSETGEVIDAKPGDRTDRLVKKITSKSSSEQLAEDLQRSVEQIAEPSPGAEDNEHLSPPPQAGTGSDATPAPSPVSGYDKLVAHIVETMEYDADTADLFAERVLKKCKKTRDSINDEKLLKIVLKKATPEFIESLA